MITYMGQEVTPERAKAMSANLKRQIGEKQYKKLMKYAKMLNTFHISPALLQKAVDENKSKNNLSNIDTVDTADMIELMCVLAHFE